jgi:hypothetical protein
VSCFGKCACQCCGPLEAPSETLLSTPAGQTKLDTDWTTDPCCKTVTLYPDSTAWQYACSDAARTQQINESFDYKVYLRQLQVVTGATGPVLECTIDKNGVETCVLVDANGNPITCDETQTLCTTITQTASRTRSLKAAAKYRLTKIEATLYRVTSTCAGETEPTCKFVLVARGFVEIYYGNVIQLYLSRSTTGETSCCSLNVDFDTLTDETCQDAIEREIGGFTYGNIVLTRSKWYATMPSGTITLTPSDEIDCDTTLSGCVSPVGDQTLSVSTSNVGGWTTKTATCTQRSVDLMCRGLYDSGGVCCLPFNIGMVNRSVGTVDGNIVGIDETMVQYLCNGDNSDCINQDTENCDQEELWDLLCENLSSTISDTGYTAKTLSLFNSNWVITITP